MAKANDRTMKFETNLEFMTLENLEKNVWPAFDNSEGSHLIKTCNSLRKKPFKDFSIEVLRIMIGQNIGLEYLISMAIDVLKKNILAEGDLYKGDLLKSVLTSEKDYWTRFPGNWKIICGLVEEKAQELKEFDTTWEIKKGWLDSYKQFKSYGR